MSLSVLKQNRKNIVKVLVNLLDCLLQVFVLLDVKLSDCFLDVSFVFLKGCSFTQELLVPL